MYSTSKNNTQTHSRPATALSQTPSLATSLPCDSALVSRRPWKKSRERRATRAAGAGPPLPAQRAAASHAPQVAVSPHVSTRLRPIQHRAPEAAAQDAEHTQPPCTHELVMPGDRGDVLSLSPLTRMRAHTHTPGSLVPCLFNTPALLFWSSSPYPLPTRAQPAPATGLTEGRGLQPCTRMLRARSLNNFSPRSLSGSRRER